MVDTVTIFDVSSALNSSTWLVMTWKSSSEAVPAEVAREVDRAVSIFTFSIGGGSAGNCQLLNGYDLIGGFNTFKPKFAKRFGNVADVAENAFKEFVSEVKANTFPDTEHSYSMSPSELNKFNQYLEGKRKS